MPITQAHRILYLNTPLGQDALLLSSFSGTEAMSRLFSYELLMASEQDSIEAKDIVGKNVSWSIQFKNGPPRFFNGFVSRFAGGGLYERNLRSYRAEVVPWLWFLTRTANCRIFQKKSAPEIIKKTFDDLGFSNYQLELKKPHPKREYCVQYRETAFNFVSRLMEEEGIFYFFRHDDGQHMLVLADQNSSYKDLPEKQPDIDSWEHQFEFRPGKWTRTDYNFETPSTNLLTSTNTVIDLPDAGKFEMFDYPGDYLVKGDGAAGTKVRMEEEEIPYEVATGTSECYALTPGGKFTLEHEAQAETGQGYVVTYVQHSATDASFESNDREAEYRNLFHCIPDSVAFRLGRQTAKPMLAGVQTAVVVGPKGEEIYTDKYGRVKVQFFWDREGKKNEDSSCWIRVAENWAGKGWGMVNVPRIGQEVIVDFLEGDPDRPIITGRVYNAEQMPPYELPKHKMVSGLKSNSTPGGGGYNGLIFDDTKGKEKISLHGQYDMDSKVRHDKSLTVLNNRSASISADDSESVGGNQTLTVKGTRDVYIKKDQMEEIDGTHHITVKGDRNEKVTGTVSLDAGSVQTKAGTTCAVDSGQEVHIKAGQKVVLEAGMEVTIKGAGGFIKIDASGVTIVGTLVNINSGGAAGTGTDCKVTAPTAPRAGAATPD